MANVRIASEELKVKLGSKKHLHMVISIQCCSFSTKYFIVHLYLPPIANSKLVYLR